MRKRIIPLLLALWLLLGLYLPVSAAAAPLDPQHSCSLTLHYTKDGSVFPNLEIGIYRVASASADGTFDLIAPYSGYPVNIHGITAQSEWRTAATTLVSYIIGDERAPDHIATTDQDGNIRFQNLSTGLYLILGATGENEKGTYVFEDFLLYLPTPQADGSFQYDMEAIPKPSSFTPITEYKIVKLWKDTSHTSKRPQKVEIEVLKDGKLHDTVILTPDGNWSHSWKTNDTAAKWTVREKNVPTGYKVAVSQSEGTFTVTNTYSTPGTGTPKTGDTFPLLPCVMTMCISGFLLLLLGAALGRRRRA